MPSPEIRSWIEEQHNRGINVSIVREADIATEPDLATDFAIYGDRATGTQEIDEQSRTLRFILSFDPQTIRLARNRWQRLSIYAIRFGDLLDQSPPTA